MRITATNTIPGRIDLSSLERYQEDNPIEELHFHATIGPDEFMDVDDKWYTLIQIQNSLGRGWITITNFDDTSVLPHAPTHTNGDDDIATMGGDSGSGGIIGLVPAPAAGDAAAGAFLKADGTWSIPPGGGGGAPDPHAASHENGGSDEISVAGLSGTLADPQTAAAHGASHTDGTDDVADLIGDGGAGGTHGLVPAPAAGDAAAGKYLDADGTWTVPPGGGGGGGTWGSIIGTLSNQTDLQDELDCVKRYAFMISGG